MADERSSDDERRARNLEDWEVEIRRYKTEISRVIQKKLGNCSNKNECAEDVFDAALINVSNRAVGEVDVLHAYFITTAKNLVLRHSKACLTCSKNCTSLNKEDDSTEDLADEASRTGLRRNGRSLVFYPNEVSAVEKNFEKREEWLELLRILKEMASEQTEEEKVFLKIMIDSALENREILSRLRSFTHISYVNMKTKKCRMLKKIKDRIREKKGVFKNKRGKNE